MERTSFVHHGSNINIYEKSMTIDGLTIFIDPRNPNAAHDVKRALERYAQNVIAEHNANLHKLLGVKS